MSFRDLLRDTLVTLWAQKRRTLLTMFGIAWGIISITVMVAAGEGLGDGIQKNQETFGKDVMIVFSGRTSMQAGGTRSGRLIHWMEDDYIQEVLVATANNKTQAARILGIHPTSLLRKLKKEQ